MNPIYQREALPAGRVRIMRGPERYCVPVSGGGIGRWIEGKLPDNWCDEFQEDTAKVLVPVLQELDLRSPRIKTGRPANPAGTPDAQRLLEIYTALEFPDYKTFGHALSVTASAISKAVKNGPSLELLTRAEILLARSTLGGGSNEGLAALLGCSAEQICRVMEGQSTTAMMKRLIVGIQELGLG